MSLSPNNAIQIVSDAEALAERLYEWMETPEGTMTDLPSWGNSLAVFKHEAPSVNLNVAAEILLLEKLPQDIDDLIVVRVGVDFTEIDNCNITIEHQFGIYTQSLAM